MEKGKKRVVGDGGGGSENGDDGDSDGGEREREKDDGEERENDGLLGECGFVCGSEQVMKAHGRKKHG